MPRVVTAGVPSRMPLGLNGELVSKGMVLRLTVMPALCSAVSAGRPSSPSRNTSTSSRWVSVPPDTTRNPCSVRPAASARALATIRAWYCLNSGCIASRKQTALAAMTCTSGPPCIPGNTILSMGCAYWARLRMNPERGPRSVLCVVEVTMSEYGTGLG